MDLSSLFKRYMIGWLHHPEQGTCNRCFERFAQYCVSFIGFRSIMEQVQNYSTNCYSESFRAPRISTHLQYSIPYLAPKGRRMLDKLRSLYLRQLVWRGPAISCMTNGKITCSNYRYGTVAYYCASEKKDFVATTSPCFGPC